MECKSCKAQCVKAGYTRNGTQRHFCKPCNKYQQQEYVYRAYTPGTSPSVIRLLREGVGIRSIARILKISVTTVTLRIRTIAKSLRRPRIDARQDVYEIDELWTFVGKKENATWISYALGRSGKQVVDVVVGSRTMEHLSRITTATLALSPSKVCTDGLPVYRSLIPTSLHRIGLPHTRRIERFNLNL